jgi:hypothetical protein
VIEPLFVEEGDLYVPSMHTRSPWDDRAQHGGAAAALLGRAIEAVPCEVPMMVARFTVDIRKPIPLQPLRVGAWVERHGRRVQLLSAALSVGDDEVCRVSAWRIRIADLKLPVAAQELPFPGPDKGDIFPAESDEPAFHRTGVQMSFVRGSFFEVGPSTVWIRLLHPVIAGETPSPLMRTLAAADFGNGISSALEWGRYVYINTDLTVYLHRQPEGEWICLDARSSVNSSGAGLAESALYDVRGPIGRSLQALFVDELKSASA